jgi:tetratricopeptide (TPR) repeat protein
MQKGSRKYEDYKDTKPLFDRLVYDFLIENNLCAAELSRITGTPEQYFSEVKSFFNGRRNKEPRGISPECRRDLCEEFDKIAQARTYSFDHARFQRAAGLDLLETIPNRATNRRRYRHASFDSENLLKKWESSISTYYINLYQHGQALQVEATASAIYSALLEATFPTDNISVAKLIIEHGLLIGQAQEVRLPWYKRLEPALQTYNDVERQMSEYLTLPEDRMFLRLHAKLCVLRGSLLREVGKLDQSIEVFNAGIRSAKEVKDRFLMAALFRNMAHVHAVQGNGNQWDSSLKIAQSLSNGDHWLYCLYKVIQGNGLKRFAYNPHANLSLEKRRGYALQALACFAEAERLVPYSVVNIHTLGIDCNVYFRRLFRAQCLVWVDPDQALKELAALGEEKDVRMKFPSMLMKIAYAEFTAICLRGWDETKLPPVFNLDKDHAEEAFQKYYAAWQKMMAYSEVYV